MVINCKERVQLGLGHITQEHEYNVKTKVNFPVRFYKSLHTSQVAHQAGAYPSFSSMKRLGVFLLPPGWDASPSQGYPPALNSPVPIYTPGWREAL